MGENRPSICAMLTMAIASGNQRLVDRIVTETMGELTHKITGVAKEYSPEDLPLVVAAMKITANALEMALGEGGKGFVEKMMAHTTYMGIDLGEMKKQMEEQDAP